MLQWTLLNMSVFTGMRMSLGFICEMEMLSKMTHVSSDLLITDGQGDFYNEWFHQFILPPAAWKSLSDLIPWLRLGFV